jgi:MFS family permease
MLTVFLAGGALAGLFGGHLSDLIGRRTVILVSMLIYPVLAALLLLAHGPWLWAFSVLSGAALLDSFSVTIVWTQ